MQPVWSWRVKPGSLELPDAVAQTMLVALWTTVRKRGLEACAWVV
jgi:hypothetical protein